MSIKDERGTPEDLVRECMVLAGGLPGFDLDVAASKELHVCERYYTKEGDGLSRPWDGRAVWCNPPYSDIEPWIKKAIEEINKSALEENSKTICILIPAVRTEQPFWQDHIEPIRDGRGGDRPFVCFTHFIRRRRAFAGSGRSPPFGLVLVVLETKC